MQNANFNLRKAILSSALILWSLAQGYGQTALTIEKAMEIAATNSPTLQTSKMDMDRAEQELIARKAQQKSNFSLTLNPVNYRQTRTVDDYNSQWFTQTTFQSNGTFSVRQPIMLTDGTLNLRNTFGWRSNVADTGAGKFTTEAFLNSLSLELSQPIFAAVNTQKMRMKQLEYALENSTISYAIEQLRIENDITEQYYQVYTEQTNLENRKTDLATAQENLDLIKNKVEADMSAREELFQAEVNLAQAQYDLEDQIVKLENAKEDLKQLIGMDQKEDILIAAEIKISPVKIDVEKAVNNGLTSRLELRQREITTANLDFDLKEAKKTNEFSGTVTLSVGLDGDNAKLGSIFDKTVPNPTVSVALTVPLFDWGERKATIRAVEINQLKNTLQAKEQVIDIEKAIRQACRALSMMEKNIAISQQRIENAQMTFDLNQVRYREGDITGMEFKQFQSQLTEAKTSHLATLINYKKQLLALKVASLYDFEKDVPVLPLENIKKTNNKAK